MVAPTQFYMYAGTCKLIHLQYLCGSNVANNVMILFGFYSIFCGKFYEKLMQHLCNTYATLMQHLLLHNCCITVAVIQCNTYVTIHVA